MTDAIPRTKPGPWAVPRPFLVYTLALAAVAAVILVLALARGPWSEVVSDERFWVMAAFVVLGELLPIEVPRRGLSEQVTISTAFAFAVLLSFGLEAAVVVYTIASLISDLILRIAPIKVLFNAAQYIVSIAAAGAVLAALAEVPVSHVGDDLGAVLLAGFTWFAFNHVLVGVGGSFLTREPLLGWLTEDLAFQGWTAGFLLTLAPLVVLAADASIALIGVAFVPMLAIYLGGRQAAMNQHRATHDSLTGLPNRPLLTERLDRTLTAGAPVAVVLVALDDVSTISDALGQESGDRLVAGVAPRLAAAVGEDDALARLGADEFAALLTGPSAADGGRAAIERLLAAAQEPCVVGDLRMSSSASVGIALYPEHGNTADALLRRAAVALASAKAQGIDVETYVPQGDERGVSRLALAGQLRHAIETGEIFVRYQPKVALPDGSPRAVEALVRWRHPQLGEVGPDGFIDLAEKTGLIAPLTQVVLEAALGQLHGWRAAGLETVVAVNISTRSLRSRDLLAWIDDGLRRWSVDPRRLQLEITESTIVRDFRRTEELLDEIRGLGISIAIDDFGTGFSSLAQLQQLPVDEIKIDRSFVADMETNPRNAAIVRATIDLARELGLAVTAEGVETAGAYVQLARLGCDHAQGYVISRPLEPAVCTAFLRRPAPGLTIPPLAAGEI
jgi:diguanylate cyclase (GGDEF)-like protein